MLENWLSPVPVADLQPANPAPFQLGQQLTIYSGGKVPDLSGIQVALVGVNAKEANAIRKSLYTLSFPFEGLRVADLGNTRTPSSSFIIPLLNDLNTAGIIPILLSGDHQHALALYKALETTLRHINLVLIDERIRLRESAPDADDNLLNDPVFAKKSKLFHLGLIGCQSHLVDPETLRFLSEHHHEVVRLGNARAAITEVEPVIRDADLACFHLPALKRIEAPAQSPASPSGFFLEEACQIVRYAGMSDKLKAFGIFGFKFSRQASDPSPAVVAQLIWYFLDGFHNRKGDFPISTEGLVEYIVDFKKLEYQLTFWKSQKSGRWWLQIPVKTRKDQQRHRLVPCSYADYRLACQDELPERLLAAMRRFD